MAKKATTDKAAKAPDVRVAYWLREIDAAKKREKDYRKHGQEILDLYSAEKEEQTPFNILYSNTETLLPALYSAVPRPVVQRRFKDADPLGKLAAEAGERVLAYMLNTNIEGYETYNEGMTAAVLDAALPGRGVTSVKYDAEMGVLPDSAAPQLTGQDAPPAEGGTPPSEEATPYTKSELVCLESRLWNRVLYGYAKKWSEVPWLAYELYLVKKECARLFGDNIANAMTYTDSEDREEDEAKTDDEKDKGDRQTVCVYQIWDKDGGRKVRYVSPQYKDGELKAADDDPLQLTGFYNTPRPLMFVAKSHSLKPTALYRLYENQAKELNRLSVRIQHIIQAIKARGVYDAELGEELGKLMQAEDNALVAADKSSSLAAEKGLQNAIWFMPIEQLIAVLVQLYQAREQCKQVIYEITGISDILRGSTQASETATAQTIKNQWGTLRLKRLQKEVQRYAVDLLRMMLEVAATKFSEDTWAKMTGLPFLTTQQHAQAEQIAMAAQMTGQQLDPQTQAKLQAPVWGDVLKILRDDLQRAYRIDIETNSTVEPEAAEDQKQITDLLTALAQYLNGIAPLVVQGALPIEAAKAMLLAITRRFRFGDEIEDYIQQMQQPQSPDAGKQQAEQQAQQAEMAQKQQEGQMKLQGMQMKAEGDKAKQAMELQKMQMEMQKMQLQLEMEREKMAMEMAMARSQHSMNLEELHSKHAVGMAAGQMKLQQMKQQAKQPAKASA